jgi:uncharacterized membrane protein YphA (DoxX/SURF4 family)
VTTTQQAALAHAPNVTPSPSLAAALTKITATTRDPAATVVRVALGVVLAPHGLQQVNAGRSSAAASWRLAAPMLTSTHGEVGGVPGAGAHAKEP